MDGKTCSGRGKEGHVIVHRQGRPILNLVGGEVFQEGASELRLEG